MAPQTHVLTVLVPAPLFDELRRRAAIEDRSVSAVVRRALATDLAGREPTTDVRLGDGDTRRFDRSTSQ